MKPSDIIAEARPLLQDTTSATYTWSDPQLLVILCQLIRRIQSDFPVSRLTDTGTRRQILDADLAATDDIPMDASYRARLVHGLVALTHETDASDDNDLSQAKLHWGHFDDLSFPGKGMN